MDILLGRDVALVLHFEPAQFLLSREHTTGIIPLANEMKPQPRFVHVKHVVTADAR